MTEPAAQREVRVPAGLGLHMRASGLFVRTASRYDAEVRVRCGERETDGASIIGLLSLAASPGRTLTLTASGPDADAAVAALAALVSEGFGE